MGISWDSSVYGECVMQISNSKQLKRRGVG